MKTIVNLYICRSQNKYRTRRRAVGVAGGGLLFRKQIGGAFRPLDALAAI
jgi:hypothetical protein